MKEETHWEMHEEIVEKAFIQQLLSFINQGYSTGLPNFLSAGQKLTKNVWRYADLYRLNHI